MEIKPKISIITVVKNEKSNFERTIESVLMQVFKDYELVVVDGGSLDGTMDVIKKHQGSITRWVSEKDGGISDAFNKGLHLSTGRWINFLNAGDVYVNAEILGAVAEKLDAPIISGVAKYGKRYIPKGFVSNSLPLHRKALLSHQASFVRRDVFETVGMFDVGLRLRMDYDFWVRALSKYDFEFYRDIWVDYDVHGVSGRDPIRFCREEVAINNKYFRYPAWINMVARGKCIIRCASRALKK